MNLEAFKAHVSKHAPRLLEQRRWCCWKAVDRGNGKVSKPPIDPQTGRPVDIRTNNDNLMTFDQARGFYVVGACDGVGVVTGEIDGFPLCGIDLDNIFDEKSFPLDGWEETAVRVLEGGYCEYSPSGRGLRGLAICCKPAGYREKVNVDGHDVEVRFDRQYMTITGNMPRGATTPLGVDDSAVKWLCEQYLKKPQENVPTGEKTAPDGRIQTALEKDAKFSPLWNGIATSGDESADDLSLMNKLAFWLDKDEAAMIETFRASPYAAGKDEAHRKKLDRPDYLRNTAKKAISGTTDTATESEQRFKAKVAQRDFSGIAPQPAADGRELPQGVSYAGDAVERPKNEEAQRPKPRLIRACDIPYEPPRWLISPYFQRGKGTLVQADNGTGKTAFSCAIAAHVSSGTPLLSSPVETPGNVVIVSVEDDLPILRGRVEADGGKLERVHFVGEAGGMTFNSPYVEEFIQETQARLIIFDPLQCFLGANVDMHRANETRPELAKFFDMCSRNDCSALIVSHMGKDGTGKSAVNRALGSVDIPAAMRSILQITPNPEIEGENVVFHVKCSNAPKGRSIAYTIGERGRVEWVGYTDKTLEDLTVFRKRQERMIPYGEEPLVQVFRQLITDKPDGGFWAYADLKETGMRILGYPPFSSTADLKAKLDGPLAKELQEKDGLIVTWGHKQKGSRGVRIEQYKVPGEYQVGDVGGTFTPQGK